MATRGRPRKITLGEDTEMTDATYGDVKQMVRRISKGNITNPDSGLDSVYDVDAELNKWYEAGYKLFNTHYLGISTDSYDVLYVLTKA